MVDLRDWNFETAISSGCSNALPALPNAASGKPNGLEILFLARVGLISTSPRMILASIPKTAALWVLKSMLAGDLLGWQRILARARRIAEFAA